MGTDAKPRLVRCPQCRLLFEAADDEPICTVCGTAARDASADDALDEPREHAPTRKHATIPLRKRD